MPNRRPGVQFKDGVAEVLLWAPHAETVSLILTATRLAVPMKRLERGYWSLQTDALQPGHTYRFLLDESQELPDPASLAQPEGVHGPSQALDLSGYPWDEGTWKNPPLEDYILYELHTGAFSASGRFEGIVERLTYLKELGVTAIEIMPLGAFPGSRNWGYDGVFPYAVHSAYGGARGLMDLVQACHRQGLAVVLDVVYNHFGPEGNYVSAFGPYLTDKYRTPWGGAVNFDDERSDSVRHFFIQNALMWFRDFHIDTLRLDAVHAIWDLSAKHILQDLREAADGLEHETGRRHYLIAETELNDARYINSRAKGGYGMDAQWLDDFHHALRVSAGQPRSGYYSDFDGIGHLAKAFRDAFVYDGIYSAYRERTFGSRASENPGAQFVVYSQNHDQVGNRMLGERTSALHSFEMQKLLAGAVILSPYLPLLFMGEEYGETNPFLYFVSHTDPELVEGVRAGRKEEFKEFFSEGEPPDPQSEDSFLRSKLQWELISREPHATLLRYYKALLALRKSHPLLKPERKGLEASADTDRNLVYLVRHGAAERLSCYLNFSASVQELHPSSAGCKLFDSAAPEWAGPADAPGTVQAGGAISIQPESILIYSHDV